MTPPAVPSTHIYTSCYCEENIYLLAEAFTQQPGVKHEHDDNQVETETEAPAQRWDPYVVFVSNDQKSVCFFCHCLLVVGTRVRGCDG